MNAGRRNPWRDLAPLAACALAAACSGPAASGPDAGAPDAEPAIAPPVPPAPPAFTPCPAGWREVLDDDLVTCDPWPEGGPQACAGDEAHFPGEAGCARLGPACPADGWPAGIPAGVPVRWVRAGSPPGGIGSKDSPYASIYSALFAAAPGTVIAIATGLYQESFTLLQMGIVLQGACVAGTRIEAAVPSQDDGTIHVIAPGTEIHNVSIGGPRRGIMVLAGGSVHVEDVLIAGAEQTAVFVEEGALTARSLVVRDTLGQRSDGANGRGLTAQSGARVDITRAIFENNRGIGVGAFLAGTTVTLSDVVVRDTHSQDSDGTEGRGLHAQDQARLEVARALVERNHESGVAAFLEGTTVALQDVIVRDTRSQVSELASGRGLHAEAGARVELARVTFDRNRDIGVFGEGDGTTLLLSDVAVRDTDSQESDGKYGYGLAVQYGTRVEGARAVFARNRGTGLVAGHGANLALSDVVVRDTRSQDYQGRFGRGVSAQSGAAVELERALLERNRDVGAWADGAGTIVTLSDLTVTDTLDQECRATGTCAWSMTCHVGSYEGAAIDVRRFLLVRSAFLGVQLAPVPAALGGTETGGTVDLHEGVVAENPIGVNVQTEGFDLARIRDRVTWGPNVVNLVTDTLAVPDPGGSP